MAPDNDRAAPDGWPDAEPAAATAPTVAQSDTVAPAEAGSSSQGARKRRSRRSRRTQSYPVRTAWIIVAFGALLILSLLGPLMTFADKTDVQAQLIRQVCYIAIFLVTLWAVRAPHALQRVLVVPWPVIIALAWCWLSMIWAIAPPYALKRVFLLTLVTWSIFILVRHLGYSTSLAIARVVLVVLLATNWLTVFNFPLVGIHQLDEAGDSGLIGDWRGLMQHKNGAGLTCALTVLLFTFDPGRIPKAIRIVVIGAAGVFLWFTHSRTSIGACAAALLVGTLYSYYDYRWRGFVIGALTVCTILGALIQNVFSDPFMQTVFQNKATLSGRTVIWDALWQYYKVAPVFGAGYGSFWDIGPDSPIFQFGHDWVVTVSTGHNGYLDLLITIGPIGLALCVFAAIIWPMLRLLNWRRNDAAKGALLLSLIVFVIGHNGTESSLFYRDAIGQVFLMFAVSLVFLLTTPGTRVTSGNMDLLSWALRDDDQEGGGDEGTESSASSPRPSSRSRSSRSGSSRRSSKSRGSSSREG